MPLSKEYETYDMQMLRAEPTILVLLCLDLFIQAFSMSDKPTLCRS